jgi:lipoate-protein ligase A
MFSVLKPSRLKLLDKGLTSFRDGVTCVKEECGASIAELYEALLDGFTDDKDWRFGDVSESEKDLAMALLKKYLSPEWNFSR